MLTKQEYDELIQVPKEYLTQEDLNDIHEYESSEAGAPSTEDVQWATDILNEKDPQIQAAFRKSGDIDKALSIMKQKRNADELMISKGQDPNVKKVKSTPEDIVEKGGFQFNWRDAYEQSKGEKLRATEADAKKLQEFINSNMFNIDDDVRLKQIAYNLHMFNPNTMDWRDFINSEQGEEFKKYLEDVRKAQTEKAVEDIWEGKGKSRLVDFMLPVSKEYAKKHYNDEDFSIAGPLTIDAAANLVMAGPSAVTKALPLPIKAATNAEKVLNKPLVSFLYGNVAAPTITETGNTIYNNESIPEALARTAEGTAINIGTPRILEGMLSSAGRGIPKGDNRSVQKMIDEAANKAEKIFSDMNKGKPFPFNIADVPGGKVFIKKNNADGANIYATNVPASSKDWPIIDNVNRPAVNTLDKNKNYNINFYSVKDMPAESITTDEFNQMMQGLPFSRGKIGKSDFANILKISQDTGKEQLENELLLKKAIALVKDGDLHSLTPANLRQLGFSDKESFMNWLIRSIKNNVPETAQTYLTNASGRPEFGREAGPIENINRLLGTNLFGKDKTQEEKQKSRIQRLLGL